MLGTNFCELQIEHADLPCVIETLIFCVTQGHH